MDNSIYLGNSEHILKDLPDGSVDLIFTSPPYYNARDYSQYETYEAYLEEMYWIFHQCHRVLKEGRMLAVNTSPVLIKRESRNKASRRLPVPFDLHHRISALPFDFIDDIIWMKPEGAGWVSGRGRRFAADRNPLQYKCVPVTEYIFIYRKRTKRLIDWNIEQYCPEIRDESKISNDYERTNVWKMSPMQHKVHPAVFPLELAEKVIKYYSFVGDRILDPFAGIGTVGYAALNQKRCFTLIENNKEYYDTMKAEFNGCFGDINFIDGDK